MATLVGATVATTACKDQGASTAPAASVQSVGQTLYYQSCARCHGVSLEGNPGTGTPAIDTVRLAGLSDQMISLTVVNGKGQMPAFGGLTPVQITAIINYMRYRQ